MNKILVLAFFALIACSNNPSNNDQDTDSSNSTSSTGHTSSGTLPIQKSSSVEMISSSTGNNTNHSSIRASSATGSSFLESSSSNTGSVSSKGVSSSQTSHISSSSSKIPLNSFVDARDNASYQKVVIGGVTWMAENLNYIPASGNSWCFDNDPANCDVYGRLYDWFSAQTACPDGWHLPTDDEWSALIDSTGDADNAGKILRSTTGWQTGLGDVPGTDALGFTALPGGYTRSNSFVYDTKNGVWWTATDIDASYAYAKFMYWNLKGVSRWDYSKDYGFSVRCIENPHE